MPPAEDAHSGYTQQLGSAAPAEPNTSAFVNNIANTINTPQPKEDTSDYDNAAARLTASLAEDASATRTHARIPTAADMRKAAARFTGRAAGSETMPPRPLIPPKSRCPAPMSMSAPRTHPQSVPHWPSS